MRRQKDENENDNDEQPRCEHTIYLTNDIKCLF